MPENRYLVYVIGKPRHRPIASMQAVAYAATGEQAERLVRDTFNFATFGDNATVRAEKMGAQYCSQVEGKVVAEYANEEVEL